MPDFIVIKVKEINKSLDFLNYDTGLGTEICNLDSSSFSSSL